VHKKGNDLKISVIDKSNYLKGLLIVAKKDNQLAHSEKEMIRGIATRLGFAKDFYEDTLRNLMANKYISESPVIFSDIKIAQSFISDALLLAFSDSLVPDSEIQWLQNTAFKNGITSEWFEEKKKELQKSGASRSFALYSII
jgi:DnaJ-domain-containing protein 1